MPDQEWQDSNEINLLRAARSGDDEAFGQLYEIYAPQVFRFLYTHLNNRMDAEDLTEEVFLKAWRAMPAYRERGNPFAAFLFRVARNTLTDYYRRERRARIFQLGETDPPDPKADPSERVAAGLEQSETRRMLAELRKDYRDVLTLRFYGGLSCEQTAAVMDRSPGAVRVLQHRALAALRKLMEG